MQRRTAKVVGEFSLILPVDRIDFQSSPDNGILFVSNVAVRKGKGHFHVSPPSLLQSFRPRPLSFISFTLLFSCFRFILFYVIRSVRKRHIDQSSRSKKRRDECFDFASFDEMEFPKICDI